jgi:predicted alpha/beta hydrolase family esterase
MVTPFHLGLLVCAGGGAAAHWLARGWPNGALLASRARKAAYDNHDPRAWLARQTDWRARANAAQANSFEALPFFMGAVIIAHQLGSSAGARWTSWPSCSSCCGSSTS